MDAGAPVVGYIRVSSKRQAKADKASLPAQRERITAYCRERGLHLLTIYEDHQSGKRVDRLAYQAMLTACRAGQAQGIICMLYDRFGRSRKEAERRVWELEDQGIEVIATEEPLPAGDRGLLRTFRLWAAEHESERLALRVRMGIAGSLAQGGIAWGRPPYGYVRDGRAMQIVEVEAAVIRRMAELLLSGLSYRAVSLRLNAEGHRCRGNQEWAPSVIGRTLLRADYGGNAVFPPILAAETIAAIRERIERSRALPRGKSRSSRHLLTGLVRCACGRPLIAGTTRHRNGTESRYYWCQGRRDFHTCEHRMRNAPALEQHVLARLAAGADLAAAAAQAAALRQPARDWVGEEQRLAGELGRCDAELLGNLRLFRQSTVSETQLAVYNAETQRHRRAAEQRLAALAAERQQAEQAMQRAAALSGRVRDLVEAWEDAPLLARKALLQDVLVRVTVDLDGGVTLDWRT